MSLLTVHKIFIAGAIAVFLGYAAWELHAYGSADGAALLRAMGSVLGAAALSVYLRWVWRRRPGAPARR